MRTALYDPFATIRRLQDDMNRAFGTALVRSDDDTDSPISHWSPAVDIRDERDGFVITADVPGVAPDEIELTMENGVLTISGERKKETTAAENADYRRAERVYGTFYRRFSLPDSADVERISANSEHGVLKVRIPKKEHVQPKKIEVGN